MTASNTVTVPPLWQLLHSWKKAQNQRALSFSAVVNSVMAKEFICIYSVSDACICLPTECYSHKTPIVHLSRSAIPQLGLKHHPTRCNLPSYTSPPLHVEAQEARMGKREYPYLNSTLLWLNNDSLCCICCTICTEMGKVNQITKPAWGINLKKKKKNTNKTHNDTKWKAAVP